MKKIEEIMEKSTNIGVVIFAIIIGLILFVIKLGLLKYLLK